MKVKTLVIFALISLPLLFYSPNNIFSGSKNDEIHFWSNGPYHLSKNQEGQWQFQWMLGDTTNLNQEAVINSLNFILRDHPGGWGQKTGVLFRQTNNFYEANVIIQFTSLNGTPCDFDYYLACYYFDDKIGHYVAVIPPQYFDNIYLLFWLVSHEVGGHAAFNMWDMYPPKHIENSSGVMGRFWQAAASNFMPADFEVEAAKRWLKWTPQVVHNHD